MLYLLLILITLIFPLEIFNEICTFYLYNKRNTKKRNALVNIFVNVCLCIVKYKP